MEWCYETVIGYEIVHSYYYKPRGEIWWHTIGSDIDKDDFNDGALKRRTCVNNDLAASVELGLAADELPEGSESFVVEASSANSYSHGDSMVFTAEYEYVIDIQDTSDGSSMPSPVTPAPPVLPALPTPGDGNSSTNTNTIDIDNSTQVIINITDNSITTIDNSTTINTTSNVKTISRLAISI